MQQYFSKYVFFSILLHVVLLFVLVVSFEFSVPMPVVNNSNEVIEAMVMDMPPLPKKIIQQPVPPVPKTIVKSEPIKKDVIKPALIEKPKEAIVIPDKKQKKIKEDLIQKSLLADMEKVKDKQQKKLKQQSLQAEFEKEINALKTKTTQIAKPVMQKRIPGALAAQSKGVVDKYKALILQTISQHWLIPSNVDKKRYAELLIRVAPGGVVLDVQLSRSSGDDALDRSARAAVLKSSPLPVPPESENFEPFRQFLLKVKPENVMNTESWMS